MWLIVGLGNPGEKYTRTRHNIGFECIAYLAERHRLAFNRKRANAHIAEGQIGRERVVLAQPLTYMNLSGQAVSGLRSWYKIDPVERLLVIYDDMDLPFGRLRLRQKGGPGTHNGMKSIVAQLGGQNFQRLRLGIGQPPPEWDAVGYVLGRFPPDEAKELPTIYARAADAVEVILREGFVAAMNKYNV